MKEKKTKGSSFRGLLAYLLEQKRERERERDKAADRGLQEKELSAGENGSRAREQSLSKDVHEGAKKLRGRIIGGNMDGRTVDELAGEFESLRALRPDISKPVDHVSLSAAPGERLSDETWGKLAHIYNKKTGFERSMYVAIRHEDTNIEHIHIARSRIDFDGHVISDSNDYQRGEEAVGYLERKFKLQESVPSKDTMRRAPTRGELEQERKTGKRSIKSRLQDLIDLALNGKPTATQLISRLEAANVNVSFHYKDGETVGVLFRLDAEIMKGSDLGRGYSWQGMQKEWPGHPERGLSYEYERDFAATLRATERAAAGRDTKTSEAREQRRDAGLDHERGAPADQNRNDEMLRGDRAANPATREVGVVGDHAGNHDQSRGSGGSADRTAGDWLSRRDRSIAQGEERTDSGTPTDYGRDHDFSAAAREASLDDAENDERVRQLDGRSEEFGEIIIRDSPQTLSELPAPGPHADPHSSLIYDSSGASQRVLSIIDRATHAQYAQEQQAVGDLGRTSISGAKEGIGERDRPVDSREGPSNALETNDGSRPEAELSPAVELGGPHQGTEHEPNRAVEQALDEFIL